jgi:hypothetical protein
MTTSTCGRSRPRAATSVASSMDGPDGVAIDVEKAVNVRVRAAGGRCPCREYRVADDGSKGVRI